MARRRRVNFSEGFSAEKSSKKKFEEFGEKK